MKIKKAVFPVAGFGTRFLPATKAMPKELLPILDKPLIQYAAEEAIAAGIDTLIFVTGRNKRAIEDHFDANLELEAILKAKGKSEQLEMVRKIIPSGVECIFVRQAKQLGLGHAVLCAKRAVGNDPFAVLLADDFLTDYEPGVTADLVAAFSRTGKSQLSVMEVIGRDISKYGVIIPDANGEGITGLIEKPDYFEAPSGMASIGRYILTPEIFDIIRGLATGSGGEIQLADAINLHAQGGHVETVCLNGKRFDCGSIDGFMMASNFEYSRRMKNK
ncbi:UTP--glucose-1-phosphate uridylyltransferase GalU [Amylibacter sp.]|nr:UTP--glucose-1-phosphate uridylyltransferase GalU [Amylibacter sp.]